MAKHSIAPHGPFKVTVEFFITDGDQIAKASFDCPPGSIPSADDIAAAAQSVLPQVQSQVGDDFRWQTRHEFVQELFAEKAGRSVNFAVPGPDTFDAEWAA